MALVLATIGNTHATGDPPQPLRFHPKVKWLYISSGVYLDRWGGTGAGGNGFGWTPKDNYLNPPQTLHSLSAGGAVFVNSLVGLAANTSIFYNTFEPYTGGNGIAHEAAHRSGIGDFEFAIPVRWQGLSLQPQLAIPGPYDREYLVPWTGFGVYRGSLSLAYAVKADYGWALAERVLYKPRGGKPGLVEVGDYAIKGGYSRKRALARRLSGKAGMDLAYTSFTWQPAAEAQKTFSIDPKFAVSFFPRTGNELALTVTATLYSVQAGEPAFRAYASRRIFLGAYYGWYP